MRITKTVMAGSLESNDVLITLKPLEKEGIELEVESIVEKQFGQRIRQVLMELVHEFGVSSAYIHVQDRGALECTLRARMETVLERAKEAV